MRILFWLIALFGLAVGLAMFARLNTGYALLFFPPWRMELSLNAFVLLFALLVLGGYGLVKLVDWLLAMPRNVRRYKAAKRVNDARRYRREAITALIEGRYHKSVRAIKVARDAEDEREMQLIDTLIAARAAHFGRDFDARDQYIEQARVACGGRSLALDMLEAEMMYEQYRNREALVALQRVYAQSPKLTAALKLELKIRQQDNHPARVIELTDMLEKSDALDPSHAARIRNQARLNQLKLDPMDASELERWWHGLRKDEKLLPKLAAAAARQFIRAGVGERAESILVDALEANWDVAPLETYGELGRLGVKGDAVKRLARAEDWLRHHPNDHQLLLALGRMCRDAALWGKARNYLEASVAVAATPVAHAELGQLLEQLDERESAEEHYRASLGLALDLLEKRT
ncbi:heme biosynthesis protein HemY [Chitinimonas prasina]|uniref:Heme biosynthesis protein HemY n=1 Tax=Chitinimonas prasina TaxID=1434937 RepID=A0ABQ5YEI6_9NEIS|nr:heme biosynthesis HemY N-terminal domain-containing protein [Chitinimonas prasina]GLR11755.1 heme biosynthesis protein HemY [Chitinimonas prasina]